MVVNLTWVEEARAVHERLSAIMSHLTQLVLCGELPRSTVRLQPGLVGVMIDLLERAIQPAGDDRLPRVTIEGNAVVVVRIETGDLGQVDAVLASLAMSGIGKVTTAAADLRDRIDKERRMITRAKDPDASASD
jgi:hypothetical protein